MASAASPKTIELGFLEECEPWLLTNTFFPSKIGGKPAWLELENIPTLDLLKCRKCQEILVFLCQVRSLAESHLTVVNISFCLFVGLCYSRGDYLLSPYHFCFHLQESIVLAAKLFKVRASYSIQKKYDIELYLFLFF